MNAKELSKKQEQVDIAFHEQRIKDIDNGLYNQFDKSFRATLRKQSVNGLNRPCLIYNSVNLEEGV